MKLIILAIILLAIVFRKKIRFHLFKFTFVWFESHQKIGEFLGVRYVDSDDFSTSRKIAGLHIPGFLNHIEKINGVPLRIGDTEWIKSFRTRQRNPVRPVKIDLAPGRRSFVELERELIDVWHNELKECYDLPIIDDEDLKQVIFNLRRSLDSDGGSVPIGTIIGYLFDRNGTNKEQKRILNTMSSEEVLLYLFPFLTTFDTFMISLAFKTYGDELTDFFDKVPIKFLPMYENEDVLVLRLKNNGQNNPGNSVFGPKGVVCPGSNVTTDILKAIMDFTKTHTWDIEGLPEQHIKSLSGLKNLDQIYITIN